MTAAFLDERVPQLLVAGHTYDRALELAHAECVVITKARHRRLRRDQLAAHAQRVQAAADQHVNGVRDTIRAMIRRGRDQIDVQRLAQAVRTGQQTSILGELPSWHHVAVSKAGEMSDPFSQLIYDAFVGGSKEGGFPAANFSLIDQYAVNYAQQRSSALVSALTQQQQQSIRDVLAQGLRGEQTPQQLAVMLRDLVGVPPQGERAIMNFRTALEDRVAGGQSLRAAGTIESDRRALGPTVSGAQSVDDLVGRYSELWTNYWADTVARTETMTAANQGLVEGWQVAASDQLLDGGSPLIWYTAEDDAVCEECDPLDGEQVGTVDGPDEMPPLHPNCRCVVQVDAQMPGETQRNE